MEFEKEPTDEQLDELLRDVVSPAELKSQLRQIPAQANAQDGYAIASKKTNGTKTNRTGNGSWMAWMLAAGLAGIGLFVAFEFWTGSENGGLPTNNIVVKKDQQPGAIPDATNAGEVKDELVEFWRGQEQLDAAIDLLELAQLKAQLAELQQTAALQPGQLEIESIIAAVSEEYSLPLGASEQQFKSGMAKVIERYPGTRGAEIAHKSLQQENF